MALRILSLDGGGIKGAFSAAVLAALEHDTGKAAADDFDLIVGTSTGGIIAEELGLGKSAQDVVEFYRELGRPFFRAPASSTGRRVCGGGCGGRSIRTMCCARPCRRDTARNGSANRSVGW